MLEMSDYVSVRNLLLERVGKMESESIPLSASLGRILKDDVVSDCNVPPFDRSPYDGFVLLAEDIKEASEDNPVTLRIVEEIPAGSIPYTALSKGLASRIMTGARIPEGGDCVIKFEDTSYNDKTVTFTAPACCGQNIIYAGEDIKDGDTAVRGGYRIDAGALGVISSLGRMYVEVYKKPLVGIISTGSELVEVPEILPAGKIRNSNRYIMDALLKTCGCDSVYLGLADDNVDSISALLETGVKNCDMIIVTGGVSVGDYDLTAEAMENSGFTMLARGADIKPGRACAYAAFGKKIVCGLSGNPASAYTNFYAILRPVINSLAGLNNPLPEEFSLRLLSPIDRLSNHTRFIRGKLEINGDTAGIRPAEFQGNISASSLINCDVMAIIPKGSAGLDKGSILKAFFL